MSERDGYQPGVPCWVDTWQPDADAAVSFYTRLFGWEVEDTMPPDSPGKHFMCRHRGRDVAAVASRPEEAPPVPAWGTYIWVESAQGAVAKVVAANGSVVVEPFDSLDGGRIAIVADPGGAAFGVWQPGVHRGAQLVNEPGAWSMSMLNTGDPDGAKAFYGGVFGWGTDTFAMGDGEVTLWRLPGYQGGEPGQPVPRDVVGVMAPMSGDTDAAPPHWSVDFWVDDPRCRGAWRQGHRASIRHPGLQAGRPGRSAGRRVLREPADPGRLAARNRRTIWGPAPRPPRSRPIPRRTAQRRTTPAPRPAPPAG
jgi:predicted enzyme related to lactoylglutathione lyase